MRWLRWILFHSGLLMRQARESKRSVILTFHGVPRAGAEEFHDLLQYLSKHFAIVPLETLIPRVNRNESHRSAAVALSFDDGLRNHRSVVYPVLADLQLPATFYVCPGLIGRAITTWTWEFWCRIPWMSVADRREFCARAGIRNSTDEKIILQWMKTLPLIERRQVEAEIRLKTSGFAYSEAERELYELMSWEELAELDPELINIGSHTMTHCDLPVLNQQELVEELEGSRAALETRLGRPVHDFCYPDGKHNDSVVQLTSKFYRSAVTTVCGSVAPGDSPHTLKRVGANMDVRWVSWMLATHTGPSHRC